MIKLEDILKRIKQLREWEQQADKVQRTSITEFGKGRAFGNSERLESEIFFLEALITKPELTVAEDLHVSI